MRFIIVVMALAAWLGLRAYNQLVAARARTTNAGKQIDIQLKRRHDLVTGLVNAVKGAMSFERDTLNAVIAARAQAVLAVKRDEQFEAEKKLEEATGKLLALVEAYPRLKASGNITKLQEELVHTENLVALARQGYNDMATRYNALQESVPEKFVASLMGTRTAPLWEIEDKNDARPVSADLSTP